MDQRGNYPDKCHFFDDLHELLVCLGHWLVLHMEVNVGIHHVVPKRRDQGKDGGLEETEREMRHIWGQVKG